MVSDFSQSLPSSMFTNDATIVLSGLWNQSPTQPGLFCVTPTSVPYSSGIASGNFATSNLSGPCTFGAVGPRSSY